MNSNNKKLDAKTIVFAAMFALVLVVISILAILLLSRGLGNTNPPVTTKVVSSSAEYLPPYICPQELKVINGVAVGITEGHTQLMTPDIYAWVKENCVYK